jgi:hypothetical protein
MIPPVPWTLTCSLDEVQPTLVWYTVLAADGTVVLSDCRERVCLSTFEWILACCNACHDFDLEELRRIGERRIER